VFLKTLCATSGKHEGHLFTLASVQVVMRHCTAIQARSEAFPIPFSTKTNSNLSHFVPDSL